MEQLKVERAQLRQQQREAVGRIEAQNRALEAQRALTYKTEEKLKVARSLACVVLHIEQT